MEHVSQGMIVYGVGAHLSDMLSWHPQMAEVVMRVLDKNQNKIGRVAPGLDLRIESPSVLEDMPAGTVVSVAAIRYLEEITKELLKINPGLICKSIDDVWQQRTQNQTKDAYAAYRCRYATFTEQDRLDVARDISSFSMKPLLSILMPVFNPPEKYFRKALDSVVSQVYPYWELCIAEDKSTDPSVRTVLEEYAGRDPRIRITYREKNGHISLATNTALTMATGEWSALMDSDDMLMPETLYMVVKEINECRGEVDFVYTDMDFINEADQHYKVNFEPDFDLMMLCQVMYMAHQNVFRTSLLRDIGGFRPGYEGSQDHDLALRVQQRTVPARIRHIKRALYSWRIFQASTTHSNPQRATDAAYRALHDYWGGSVRIQGTWPGGNLWHVRLPLPEEPELVSIIVPCAGTTEAMHSCVENLLEFTDYPNYEILLVASNGQERDLSEISDLGERIKVLFSREGTSLSAMCNLGAEAALGSHLLFLRDDIRACRGDWLSELVATLQWEGVGIVGPMMLSANASVQHTGLTIGLGGVAGSINTGGNINSGGYHNWAREMREVSAVSGTCFLIRREVFQTVGGFDAEKLPNLLADVDACLKARQQGWRSAYNPWAFLYRMEHRNEGTDPSRFAHEAMARRVLFERYGAGLANDPCYNPNLSLTGTDCLPARRPRVGKPWRDWLEFVLAYPREDVLLGIGVACLAASKGIGIRVHVPQELMSWLADFRVPFPMEGLPMGLRTMRPNERCFDNIADLVALNPSSSGHIVGYQSGEERFGWDGLHIVEQFLLQLGMGLKEALPEFLPAERHLEHPATEMVSGRTALLAMGGGSGIADVPDAVGRALLDVMHQEGWNVVQIGAADESRLTGCDGYVMAEHTLGSWRTLFSKANLLLGAGSWASNFAVMLDMPRVFLTASREQLRAEPGRFFEQRRAVSFSMEWQGASREIREESFRTFLRTLQGKINGKED